MEYIFAVLALICLIWAAWIDLKLWILPNELVLAVAVLAIPFHGLHGADWMTPVLGMVVGGGTLWIIRVIANRAYGFETLGFGDIKLMAACGLWLGAQGVLAALSLGAFCGIIYALVLAIKNRSSINTMMIPAGPGFIIGSIVIFILQQI